MQYVHIPSKIKIEYYKQTQWVHLSFRQIPASRFELHFSEDQENATSITANFYHPKFADEIPVNEMTIATIFPNRLSLILLLLPLIFTAIFRSVNATCQLSFEQNNKLYNYSLTTPIRNFPHGILSEDGYFLSFYSMFTPLLFFNNSRLFCYCDCSSYCPFLQF